MRWVELEAAPRFELGNNGFANRRLNHLAMPPRMPVPTPDGRPMEVDGAGNGARTRDIYLGKVVLYQLSYSRPRTSDRAPYCNQSPDVVKTSARPGL